MSPFKAALRGAATGAIQAYKRQSEINRLAKSLNLPIITGTSNSTTSVFYPKK